MKTSDHSNQPAARPEVDADQIFKTLEHQLASQRREFAANSRTSFRVGSLALIIGLTIAALVVLQWMVSQLPQPKARAAASMVSK